MSNTPQHQFDIASFLAGVKTQLNDLSQKVIDGSNLKPNQFDVNKVAQELDRSNNVTIVSIPQQNTPKQQQPIATEDINFFNDPNQLTFSFDKKHNLEDIFTKIDDTYRRVVSLESEVNKLRTALEEKKSHL